MGGGGGAPCTAASFILQNCVYSYNILLELILFHTFTLKVYYYINVNEIFYVRSMYVYTNVVAKIERSSGFKVECISVF